MPMLRRAAPTAGGARIPCVGFCPAVHAQGPQSTPVHPDRRDPIPTPRQGAGEASVPPRGRAAVCAPWYWKPPRPLGQLCQPCGFYKPCRRTHAQNPAGRCRLPRDTLDDLHGVAGRRGRTGTPCEVVPRPQPPDTTRLAHASAAANRSPDASGWASARWRGRGGSGSPRSATGSAVRPHHAHVARPHVCGPPTGERRQRSSGFTSDHPV